MNQGLGVALLIIGVILLVFGFGAYHSASSGVSEAVSGTPSAKAVWLLVIGVVAGVAGVVGLARK